jgi:hypothetical protein
VETLIKEEIVMKIISDMKVTDFPSGVSFKAYYQEPRLTHQGGLLFDEPYTGSLERDSVPKLDASYGTWFPVRTKETYHYRSEDVMECDITITYHEMDDDDAEIVIDQIDVVMMRHGIKITNHYYGIHDEVFSNHSRMIDWFSSKVKLQYFPLISVIGKCYHIMCGEFTELVYTEPALNQLCDFEMIIRGIASSESTPWLAETLLSRYCELYEKRNDISQVAFSQTTLLMLIYELVNQNRGEVLRIIPLTLRIQLIARFNEAGKHAIVAALNHYHKGDYKNPGEDLIL